MQTKRELELFSRIISDFNDCYEFVASDNFYWSPTKNAIYYNPEIRDSVGAWSLMHEIGHAELSHTSYLLDFELLTMEVNAWKFAKRLARSKYGLDIEDGHIEDCIESYRVWLYSRSSCNNCGSTALQKHDLSYSCHDCNLRWSVPSSRFCQIKKVEIK